MDRDARTRTRLDRIRLSHDPQVAGSYPAPATNENAVEARSRGPGLMLTEPDFDWIFSRIVRDVDAAAANDTPT